MNTDPETFYGVRPEHFLFFGFTVSLVFTMVFVYLLHLVKERFRKQD